MKSIILLNSLLLLMLCFGCSETRLKEDNVSPSSYSTTVQSTIADAIQGEWLVTFSDSTHTGTNTRSILLIQDTLYEFKTVDDEDIGSEVFLKNSFIPRNGKIQIEFWGDPSGDKLVSTFSDSDILATIGFFSETGQKRGEFLVRFDENNSLLYFHSTVSQIELDQVVKVLIDA